MKILFKNFKLKILALLCAVLFWVFIVGIQNSFYKFPSEIQVQPFNLATGLSVVNELGVVQLMLNVSQEDAKNLTAKDFTAYIDLQGMGVGESNADILVTSKNPNVTILRTDPDQIKVAIEEVDTKKIPLKHLLKGGPKEGYEVGEVKMIQDEIEVTGAKSVTQKATEGVVTFSLDGTEIGDILKKGSIKIVDVEGEEIQNLQIEQGDIEAEIEIQQISESKVVGITPSLIGSLADGWVSKITLTPQTVTVKGSPVALSKIETIETEKIDLRTITGTTTLKAQLKLPYEVTTGDGITEVRVTLEIETNK